MSKGKRNRERRRHEKEMMTATVTKAEIFCAELLADALVKTGAERDGTEWNSQAEKATALLKKHRQEIRHMYRDDKRLLKEWFFTQMDMIDGTGVRK
jgi:hypothetical protein